MENQTMSKLKNKYYSGKSLRNVLRSFVYKKLLIPFSTHATPALLTAKCCCRRRRRRSHVNTTPSWEKKPSSTIMGHNKHIRHTVATARAAVSPYDE